MAIKSTTTQFKWLRKTKEFCRTPADDYILTLYTDGTYREADHDLHSVFDGTAQRRHAAASVVILHDGEDWESRLAFSMHKTDGT